MRYQTRMHPTLDILVSSIGEVFIPTTHSHPAHWTFGSNRGRGYLRVRIAGKDYLVHRLVAETYFGEIPEGMEVDHINRVRGDNRVENLRIVTRRENMHNRADHDRVDARGGTHKYEDARQANRELCSRNYAKNRDKRREHQAQYSRERCKTHRIVYFADGSRHWVPLDDAIILMAIPLKQRVYRPG